jgi:4-hydroxy-2-oxoheptanedioate aldolase
MQFSKIKAKLEKDLPALGVALHLTDPSVYELTSLMGLDGIWMDLEHHAFSVETAGQLMRAARVGTADVIARPAKGEFMRLGRILEAGAQGIMYPRCDGPEEAAEVVRWAKFAPLGTRGFDGGNSDGLYTAVPMVDYIAHANRETLIIIQLEDERAIAQAEAIAAVPGVDVLMFGPADFTILEGFPGNFEHPKVLDAIRKIAAAAKNAGKHWARPVGSAEQARQAIEMGARLIFHNADIVMIKKALEQMQLQFAEVGFTFENQLSQPSFAKHRE